MEAVVVKAETKHSKTNVRTNPSRIRQPPSLPSIHGCLFDRIEIISAVTCVQGWNYHIQELLSRIFQFRGFYKEVIPLYLGLFVSLELCKY